MDFRAPLPKRKALAAVRATAAAPHLTRRPPTGPPPRAAVAQAEEEWPSRLSFRGALARKRMQELGSAAPSHPPPRRSEYDSPRGGGAGQAVGGLIGDPVSSW